MSLCGRHSASFTSCDPQPEPWSIPVIAVAFRWGNQGWQNGSRLPKVTGLKMSELRFQGLSPDLSLVWVISTSRPLDGWQQRAPGGRCVPGQETPACKVAAPRSTRQVPGSSVSSIVVPASPSAHQEGAWLQGPGQALTRGLAQQDQPCTLLLSPSPAHPASASSSLLLIWFLSKTITFSNNKTRVHFLTADFAHALI